jgi:hypothetical protein
MHHPEAQRLLAGHRQVEGNRALDDLVGGETVGLLLEVGGAVVAVAG